MTPRLPRDAGSTSSCWNSFGSRSAKIGGWEPKRFFGLENILGKPAIRNLEDARSVLMAVDQQDFPTSMLVRFGQEDVVFAEVNAIPCATDRRDMATSAYGAHWTVYEPHIERLLTRMCGQGAVVLDVGANVGFHTLKMASLVGPQGRVYAVEPNSENCRLILLGAEQNGFTNIELLPIALSDRRGWVYFSTHIGSNGGIAHRAGGAWESSGTVVPTFALDELRIPRVDVIKIDVEGAEYRALKGGEETLRRDRPVIICEFSMEMTARVSGISGVEFLRWISDLGYDAYVIDRERASIEDRLDPDQFQNDWGDTFRIEDLLFVPAGKDMAVLGC